MLFGSAFVVGVLSVFFLHKWISRSFRLFREGMDKEFWIYCDAFRQRGWEIFWGPTVFGIIFGLITLWYAPLLKWFLAYLLTVFFATGYYLWRENYVRFTA